MSEEVLPKSVFARYKRRGTAREAAERVGVSARTAQRWTSRPRAEWLAEKAAEREAIRRYHDELGHSWTETAAHFMLHVDTVKQRAYRARKERAAEFAALNEPALPLDELKVS